MNADLPSAVPEMFEIRKHILACIFSLARLDETFYDLFKRKTPKDKRRAVDTLAPFVDELKRVSDEADVARVALKMLCNKEADK